MIARLMIDTPKITVGIDPGMSGAVAVLGKGNLQIFRDFKAPLDIVHGVQAAAQVCAEPDMIVIEDVHAMPGQGVVSMFNFGHATGVARGAILASFPGQPLVKVAPLKWQNVLRVIGEWYKPREFDSRAIALQLFPSPAHAALFRRKKDHNSADAALMALWALHQLEAPPTGRPD